MDQKDILSPGGKIKRIRKDLNLNQEDIAKGDITRNLISLIENGKANLTKETAEVVAKNINEICKEKNLEYSTTADYLYESIIDQANKVADNYLEFIKNQDENLDIPEDKLIEIEDFLKLYDIGEKRVLIYFTIGNKFLKVNNKDNAYLYYIKAYENCNDLDDLKFPVVLIFKRLCAICGTTGKFIEALKYASIGSKQIKNLSIDDRIVFENNVALYFKKLKRYNESLDKIASIENEFKEFLYEHPERKFKIVTLKANCLSEQNHYIEALKLHKSILKFMSKKELEETIVVNGNITETYILLNDTPNIKKYLYENVKLLERFTTIADSGYAPQIYYSMGQAFEKIEELSAAKKYYELALIQCKRQKFINIVEDILNNLLAIAIKDNDLEYVNDLKNEFLELITVKMISQTPKILYKLVNFYNNIDQKERIKDMMTFLLNIA